MSQVDTIKGESKWKGGLQLAFGLSYIAIPSHLLQEIWLSRPAGSPCVKRKVTAGVSLAMYVIRYEIAHDGSLLEWLAPAGIVSEGSTRQRLESEEIMQGI